MVIWRSNLINNGAEAIDDQIIKKGGNRIMCLSDRIHIKKQTIIRMTMDLSLMTCLFRASFERRFDQEEKRYEKEVSIKFYHACSRNRLKFLFSKNSNEIISPSHTCRTIT